MAAALVEQTYDALMQMIMDGNYKPGDRLPSEMILCNNLQVSRNTLRAALNKLNVLGFTETRQGGGTYMRAVDSSVYLNFFVPATLTSSMDLLEIMQFRKGIEVRPRVWQQRMQPRKTLSCCGNCLNSVQRGEKTCAPLPAATQTSTSRSPKHPTICCTSK